MRIVQNIMQMLLSQAFLHSPYLFQKYHLTNPVDVRYNFNVVALGAWCNGNTWVSKTFVEGSNPSAPAQRESPADSASAGFFCSSVLIAQSVAWGLSLYSSGLAYERDVGWKDFACDTCRTVG